MKALTIKQPWAWAIVHGGKNVENRSTLWKYHGTLAIHAGAGWSTAGMNDPRIAQALGSEPYEPCNYGRARSQPGHQSGPFTFGAIIGVAYLIGSHVVGEWCTGPCEPWGDLEYEGKPAVHLSLESIRPLTEPVPCKGRLGLWDLDPAMSNAVARRVP